MFTNQTVVVLFSGGQDSTTCLFKVLAAGAKRVYALTISYGQRHDVEVAAARRVLETARAWYSVCIEHEEIDLGPVFQSRSPLVTSSAVPTYDQAPPDSGVQATFVEGRNLLFLTLAANRAAAVGADALVTGVCETDSGGYPDCRRDFIDAAEKAIARAFVGEDSWIPVHTPLMRLNKADTVRLATTLPGCLEALAHSHTCYAGKTPPCGQCHACVLRARGFAEAGVSDPLLGGA
jgi:7-cyano-7-deazaguanine synthase